MDQQSSNVQSSQADSQEVVSTGLQAFLPLVRVQRGFPHQVLALYENEVITGTSWRSIEFDRDDFLPHNSDRVLAKLSPGWRIPLNEITEIEFIGPSARKRGDKSWRLRIESSANPRRFVFLYEDGKNVFDYFRTKTPDRLHITHSGTEHFAWRLQTGCLWFILAAVVLFLVLGAVALILEDSSVFAVAIPMVLIGTMILGVKVVFSPINLAAVSPDKKKAPKKKSTAVPFYSPALGWFVKVLGVAWYVFSFLWIEDQMWFQWLEKKSSGPSVAGLYALLYAPTLFLVYWGYQLCQRTSSAAKDTDLSAILWLRAFDDDQRITLQPTSLLAKSLGIIVTGIPNDSRIGFGMDGSRFRAVGAFMWNFHPVRIIRLFFNKGADTAEEVLTMFFGKIGRVVAMGKPGQRLVTPGAERVFVAEDSWQQAVSERLSQAQMVLIQAGASAGVQWEIGETFKLVQSQRVLLSMAAFWRRPNAFEDFLLSLPIAVRDCFPREIPYLNSPSFLYFKRDWTPLLQPISYHSPLLWPFLGNAVDLKYTLSSFLAGASDRPIQAPRKPKEYGVQTVLAWVLAAALIALAFVGQISRHATYEAREHVLSTNIVTYRNAVIPFSLQLHKAWVRHEFSPEATIFTLGEKPPNIVIVSVRKSHLISEMASIHAALLRERYPGAEVRQDSSQEEIINGANWLKADFEIRLYDGYVIHVPSRLYAGNEGAIFMWGEVDEDDTFNLKLIEDVFGSVRIGV
jgi:hypothetical protein